MNTLLTALAAAGLIAVTVPAIFAFSRSYYGLRLKAYSPAAAGVITAVSVAALGAGLGGLGLLMMRTLPGLSNIATGVAAIIGLLVLLPAAFAGIVYLTPELRHRTGARQSMYLDWAVTRWLERAAPVLGLVALLAGISGFWWLPKAQLAFRFIQWGCLLFAVPAILGYLRKLERGPGARAVTASDRRGCVLYIRPFYQEADDFTYGLKEKIQPYVQAPLNASSSFWAQATFEQYLGPAFSRTVGPFVAIGNPRDYRRPEGAAREYLEGEEWREFFLAEANDAAAIVMEPACSKELAWEVGRVVARRWQYKLFIVVRPLPKSRDALARWLFNGARWAKHIRRPEWREFVEFAATAGLKVPQGDPGPGAVIAFDRAGRAVTLATDAAEPDDFVGPIQRWISWAFSASL